jgi:hypothetical protein
VFSRSSCGCDITSWVTANARVLRATALPTGKRPKPDWTPPAATPGDKWFVNPAVFHGSTGLDPTAEDVRSHRAECGGFCPDAENRNRAPPAEAASAEDCSRPPRSPNSSGMFISNNNHSFTMPVNPAVGSTQMGVPASSLTPLMPSHALRGSPSLPKHWGAPA